MILREKGRATNAILFTDLVGSTELRTRQGEDEADRFGVEEQHRVAQLVADRDGIVVKGMGDGVLAAFAGAADAIEAAVSIQQTSPHPVRVGVSIGDVTWDEGDCFGHPVVEAARLVARAAPGEILVADLVRVMARGRGGHRFESLGSMELKGLAEPLEVSRVKWEAAPAPAVPLPSPVRIAADTAFVGRAAELAELDRAWAAARTGHRQVVLVAAEPGAGKSRLAAEFAHRLHAEGVTVLFGGAEEELGVPYQPVVEALDHLANAVGEERIRRWAGRGADDLGHLLPRLGVAGEGERYQVFGAVVDLLRGMTTEGPVLWVVDDLQWAGRPSMLLLVHVLRLTPDLPLLVLATHRDPEDDERDRPLTDLLVELRRLEGVRRLRLSGLAVADITVLVGDDALARTLVGRTGGNPFFVTELYRHLREGGSPDHPPAGAAEVIAHRVSRLPPEAARVLALGAVIGLSFELELLQAVYPDPVLDGLEAAVRAHLIEEEPGPRLAYRFSHAVTRAALYDQLSVMRRAQLHNEVAVALEKLHPNPDPVLASLARHRSEAAVLGDALVAVVWCRRAASQAAAALGFEEAADHLRRALALAGSDAPSRLRTELLVELAHALNGAGLSTSSLDVAVAAGVLAQADHDDDLIIAAALSFGGANAVWAVSRDRRGRELVRTALDRSPVGTIDHACLSSKLAALSLFVMPIDERVELCARTLEGLADHADVAGRQRALSEFWTAINPRYDHPIYAQALDELAAVSSAQGVESKWNYILSRAEQLVAMADGVTLRRLIAEFHDGDKLSDVSRTYLLNVQGHIATWDGDFARARLLFTQAAQGGARELRHMALTAHANHAATLGWLQGDMSAARPLQDALRRDLGGPIVEAVWAWVQLGCGEPAPAQEFLTTFRGWDMFLRFVGGSQGLAASTLAAVELGDREAMVTARAAWGRIAAELYTSALTPTLARSYYEGILMHRLGDLNQAEERLRHSLLVHDRIAALPFQAASRAALAAVLADTGHIDEARMLAIEAADSSRRIGAGGIARQADLVLARL